MESVCNNESEYSLDCLRISFGGVLILIYWDP